MKKQYIEAIVRAIDPDNAPYIIQDPEVMGDFERALEYLRRGKRELAVYVWTDAKKKAREFSRRRLTPTTIRVGDGVTVNLWSDRYAATVIAVTKSTVTVRRDAATLDPGFKPEFIIGKFAGHCTN